MRLSATKCGRKLYTLVDAEDYDRVIRFFWHHNSGYACCRHSALPKHQRRLHAFVLGAEPGQKIDHVNGDRLDNRKANLRFATSAQNARNTVRQTFVGKTSKFKGVTKVNGRWIAQVTVNGLSCKLGTFSDEEEAAKAYDEAAKRLHGEFARTNADMGLFERRDPIKPDCSHGPVPISRRRRRELRKALPKGADLAAGNVYHRRLRKKRKANDLSHLDNQLRRYYGDAFPK